MKRLLFFAIVLVMCISCISACSLLGCNHKNVVTDYAVSPSCATNGLTEGSHCADCGEILVQQTAVPALGHTEVLEEAKKATCTEDGYTTSVHCSVCNAELIAKEVIPAAHTYGEWEEISASDCFFAGERQRICSACDYVDTEKLPIVEHSFTQNEETGFFSCEHCNSVIYAGHLYAAIDVQGDWYSSYEICDDLGGHLATITSESEQKIIDLIMTNAQRNIYWVGGIKNTDGWEWITDEEFEYTNWRKNQPDNAANNEWFLQVYGGGCSSNYVVGQWNDLNVEYDNHTDNLHQSVGLICEWNLNIEETEHYFTEWETVTEVSCFGDGEDYRMCVHCGLEETRAIEQLEHNFIFNEATGIKSCEHCGAAMYEGRIYKIFSENLTWFDAYQYCDNLGGHLVTITSAEEQTFLETYMSSQSFSEDSWIGAYNDGTKWQWVTNEVFEYVNWAKNQPDCAYGSEFFIQINFGSLGLWNDNAPGDYDCPFLICEWEVN